MMTILDGLLGGTIRREMKSRVDEVLKAGQEWDATAKNLTAALEKLTAAIEKGSNVEPSLSSTVSGVRKLAKETNRLSRVFELYQKTIVNLASKL